MRSFILTLTLSTIISFAFAQLNANFSVNVDKGCAPLNNVTITNLTTGTGTLSYTWNFGKGEADSHTNSSTLSTFYTNPGTYTISLTVTNGTDYDTFTKEIKVFKLPQAKITPPAEVCVSYPVTFTASAVLGEAPIDRYIWDLKDGIIHYGQTQTKQYITDGTYSYTAIVIDTNDCESAVSGSIKIWKDVDANFTLSKAFSCTPPLTTQITNTSTSERPLQYKWKYSDGQTYTSQTPPARTFTSVGNYTLKLNVENDLHCKDSIEKSISIQSVTGKFSIYYLSQGNVNVTDGQSTKGYYSLIDETTETTNCLWKIGTSTYSGKSLTYLFCEKGTYPVTLITGTESECPDTVVHSVTITDENPWSIQIQQFGVDVVGDTVCTNEFRAINPVPGATAYWTYNGETKVGNNVSFHNCTTGTSKILLEAKYSSTCIVQLERTITIKNCNPLDFKIINNGEELTGTTGCYGQFDFIAPQGTIASEYTLTKGAFTKNIITTNYTETLCDWYKPAPYTITLNASLGDNCPQTKTKTFTFTQCDVTDFSMYNINTDKVLTNGDNKCAHDTIEIIPEKPNEVFTWLSSVKTIKDTIRNRTYLASTDYSGFISMVQKTQYGCFDTITKFLYNKTLNVNFDVVSKKLTCDKEMEISFVNTSEDLESFTWEVYNLQGDSQITHTNNTNRTYTYSQLWKPNPMNPTDRDISEVESQVFVVLIGRDAEGCSNLRTKQFISAKPKAWFFTDKSFGCTPLTVNLQEYNNTGIFDYETFNFFETFNINSTKEQFMTQNAGNLLPAMKNLLSQVMSEHASLAETLKLPLSVLELTFVEIIINEAIDQGYQVEADKMIIEYCNYFFDNSRYVFPIYAKVTKVTWDFGDGNFKTFSQADLADEHSYFLDCINAKDLKINSRDLDLESRYRKTQKSTFGSYYSYFDFIVKNKVGTDENAPQECIDAYLQDNGWTSYTYTTPGIYYPKVIVEDETGCADTTESIKIEVGDVLNPNFSLSPTSICPGDTVQFTDLTPDAQNIDSWHFFSKEAVVNTSCSYDANPAFSVMSNEAGMKDMSLRVEYNGCFSEVTLPDALELKGPIAQIDWEPVCSGTRSFDFTASVSGATSYSWDFGDKTSLVDNQQNTNHQFGADGVYTIVLTATNSGSGCPNYTDTAVISAKQLKAGLSVDSVLCIGKNYTMSTGDSSINYNTSGLGISPFLLYINDFPMQRRDNSVYEFNAGYTSPKKFVLVTYDENGCIDSDTSYSRIHQAKASFISNTNYVCEGKDSIEFVNTPRDTSVYRWTWTIDNNFVNVYTPESDTTVYTFDTKVAGPFNVSLEVYDIWGCRNSTTKTYNKYVPKAQVLIEDTTLCTGNNLRLTNTYTGGSDTLEWYVRYAADDDSIYNAVTTTAIQTTIPMTERGAFTLKQVTHQLRCSDTAYYKNIDVHYLDASFTIDDDKICKGDTITTTHLRKFDENSGTWSIPGIQSTMYTDSVQKIVVPLIGTVPVTLTLFSPYGCTDSKTNNLDLNSAEFYLTDPALCKNDSAFFNMYYTKSGSVFVDYGDGTQETIVGKTTFAHQYTERGDYDVKMISYTEGCIDSTIIPDVLNIQEVNAKFDVNDSIFCINKRNQTYGILHLFQNTEDILDATEGNWYYQGNPTGIYTPGNEAEMIMSEKGIYLVGLEVRSPNGCTDKSQKPIKISGPEGMMHVVDPDICRAEKVEFGMSDTVGVTHWLWDFGDGKYDSVSTAPKHSYFVTGKLTAQFVYFNADGCSDYETALINIEQVDAGFILSKDTICMFDTISITDTSRNNTSWEWNYGNGNTSIGQYPEDQQYIESGNITIELYIENNNGCKDTASTVLTVIALPEIELTTIDSICKDKSLDVTAAYNSANTIQWFKAESALPNTLTTIYHDTPEESTNYNVIVTDQFGCVNYDTAQVYVFQYPEHLITTIQQKGTHYEKEVSQILVSPYDTAFYIGQTFEPVISSPYPSSYIWSTDFDINDTTVANPKMRPLEDAVYYLTVTDQCFTREYVLNLEVVPEAKFDVPTGFTPNGDGYNDVLYVRGWGIQELLEFSVYNRWGQLVFSTNKLEEGWDGVFNDKEQASDTYVYIVKVSSFLNDEYEKKGYVTLLR